MVGGSLKMLTGSNKNETRIISAHNTGTGQVTTEVFSYAIASGDSYIIESDKSKSTCKGFAATGAWSGNEGYFGGYDEQLHYGLKTRLAEYDIDRNWRLGA